jgi:hypothetical protein
VGEYSRRGFLTRWSMGAGLAVAGIAVLPRSVNAPVSIPEAPNLESPIDLSQAPAAFAGPLVVHVRDLARAEVAVLVGHREVVYRDPALVSRLLQGAQAASAEG